MSASEEERERHYWQARWKVGQRVEHTDGRLGVLVKRGGTLPVNRDDKPPWVRFDGKIDAAPVPYDDLSGR